MCILCEYGLSASKSCRCTKKVSATAQQLQVQLAGALVRKAQHQQVRCSVMLPLLLLTTAAFSGGSEKGAGYRHWQRDVHSEFSLSDFSADDP